MRILISDGLKTPIYEQIAKQIAVSIVSGELDTGKALPSIRSLARELRVSAITTARAYSELESRGLVTAVKGKGYYARSGSRAAVKSLCAANIKKHLCAAVKEAEFAGISKGELKILFAECAEKSESGKIKGK